MEYGLSSNNEERKAMMHRSFINNSWIKHSVFWLLYWIVQSLLMSTEGDFVFYLAKNFSMIFLQALLVYFNLFVLIPNFLLKQRNWTYFIIALVSVYLVYTFSFHCIQFTLKCAHQIIPSVHPLKFPDSMLRFNFSFWQVFSGSVPYSLAVACSTAYYFIKSNQEKEKEKIWLAAEKSNTELKFLKAQISPHFLFNSLNNLHYLIGKDRVLSEKYTLKLSEILRYIVYESKENKVSLASEVDHIKAYIELMKMSIEFSDNIEWQATGDFEVYEISPLILLSIIENGFKHSGIKYNKLARLMINLEVLDGILNLEMTNSVDQNLASSSFSGSSLMNLTKRLKILYPEKHDFLFEIKANQAFTTLSIELS